MIFFTIDYSRYEHTGWFLTIDKMQREKTDMESAKDEFNIPSVITDPRAKTQYSKGRFLGKVCSNKSKRKDFICVL